MEEEEVQEEARELPDYDTLISHNLKIRDTCPPPPDPSSTREIQWTPAALVWTATPLPAILTSDSCLQTRKDPRPPLPTREMPP